MTTDSDIRPTSSLVPERAGAPFLRALLGALLDESPDGVLVVDADGKVVTMNAGFNEAWRMDPELARDPETGIIDDEVLLAQAIERVADADAFISRVRELYEDPSQRDHAEILLGDGRTLERDSAALWTPEGDYVGRVWFFRDISDRKRREEALSEMAATDDLTGLANRRHLTTTSSRAIRDARTEGAPLALLLADIDRFKMVNDVHGHSVGDEILRACARRWTQALDGDALVARIGGDEFAVLLPGADCERARAAAERLRAATADVLVDGGNTEVRPTISVGVSCLRNSDSGLSDLLDRADESLYVAKRRGRDGIGPLTDSDLTPIS